MKRCIKWLTNWLSQWLGDLYLEQIVKCVILLGIVLSIVVFTFIEKVPATPSDYEQLENQVNLIWQKQELSTQIDCSKDINIHINTNGKNIIVTVENSKCKVIEKYDKNFELLSVSKEDKGMSWLLVFIYSFIIGIGLACGVGIIIWAIVRYFYGYWRDVSGEVE